MYRKILLAVDGSPGSLAAATTVGRLASLAHAEVLLVYCEEVLADISLPLAHRAAVARLVNERLGPARDILMDFAVSYVEMIVQGNPAVELVRLAMSEHCDLVALGAHGDGPASGMQPGPVAQTVLELAPCTVLLVRPEVKIAGGYHSNCAGRGAVMVSNG